MITTEYQLDCCAVFVLHSVSLANDIVMTHGKETIDSVFSHRAESFLKLGIRWNQTLMVLHFKALTHCWLHFWGIMSIFKGELLFF